MNADLPMRPEMGERTLVYSRLMRAVFTAARFTATSASACLNAACASSYSCLLTALIASSSRKRSAFSRAGVTLASAFMSAACALSKAASYVAGSIGILPIYGTASYGVLQGPIFRRDGGSVARDATMKKPTIPGGPGKMRGFFPPRGPTGQRFRTVAPCFLPDPYRKKR